MFAFPLAFAALVSTAEINALSRESFEAGHGFALTGTVTSVLYGNHFILRDGAGSTHIRNMSGVSPALGDRVVLRGQTAIDTFRQEQSLAESVRIVGEEALSPPTTQKVEHIANGRCNYANVTTTGFATDIFRDDNDPDWSYLVLEAGGSFLYVTIPDVPGITADPDNFIRQRVRVTGTVVPNHCGARRFIGPHVQTASFAAVEMLPQPRPKPFPDGPVNHLPPVDVIRHGTNELTGTARCVWGGRSMLIEGKGGEIHRIDLAGDLALPPVGSVIRACGLPETDLYRLNLSHAAYTVLSGPTATPEVTVADKPDFGNSSYVHWSFHGRPVRLSGRILAEATPTSGYRAMMECSRRRISIDVSSVPELTGRLVAGTEVSVGGCGLVDIDNWRPGAAPPAQKDFVLVVRRPDDLRVIAYPPWWTPARLLVVILALVALLIAIAIWNRLLNKMVERRSRQLLREEMAHTAAELKTQERTRLAVELHDALSQTLTGVAWQIDAADSARQKDPGRVGQHLNLARRTIDSCREELRNCLWDLRNLTLEDADAESAIRRTVAPHAAAAEVSVAFPVSRRVLSDNTFHEILCILRELVTNAVRHGKAKHIGISGRIADGSLVIAVADDGCGFDPENRPGSAEGHFGLLGVTERIRKLGGTLRIDSAPGRGATFTLSLSKRHEA